MGLELVNPPELHEPSVYSHLAIGRGSRIVFVAGQVGYDRDGNLAGEDHAAQAEQAFRNLAAALEGAGAQIGDVAKVTIYVANHTPELLGPIMGARATGFGEHKPASTYVGVAALIRPELLVEVEAVAVLD
jgi:enamine deaminase RidA (YjgF/YER057c/UK114 family)